MADLRTGDIGDLRVGIATLDAQMHKLANRLLVALIGLTTASAALAVIVATEVG